MLFRVARESLGEARVFAFLWKHTLTAGAAKDSTVAALAYLAQPSRGLYSTYASSAARMRVRSMRGVCYSFLTQLFNIPVPEVGWWACDSFIIGQGYRIITVKLHLSKVSLV